MIDNEILVTSRNISQWRQMAKSLANDQLRKKQKQLVAAKRVAEEASRAKTHFLANMNHELRTPLNAIIGFSSIIESSLFGPLTEKYVDAGSTIKDAGEHLLQLINNVLDLARAEVDRIALHEEELDIHEAIAVVGRIIGEMARNNDVEFNVAIADELPILYADPTRLRQILINLLANAVKFTPSGGKVNLDIKTAEQGAVIFRIEDTGIGIPKDKIPLVFRPFGQVENAAIARRHPGSGIGLPLAARLVELHDGRLKLSSRLGHGTTVSVTLPPGRSRWRHPFVSATAREYTPPQS
jgi:signal transduction histidine kinase